MKLSEFLKQFEGMDENTEILVGDNLINGYAKERVIPWIRYVTSVPRYGCDRKYHFSKTKKYKKAVIVLAS